MWVMDCRKNTQLHRFESKKKISLPMGTKAEDTLKVLRLSEDTSGHVRLSESVSKSRAESSLGGSGSEDSLVSGPSSPSPALHPLRCRKCEGLFSKMKRQKPRRKKTTLSDPASLSCDEWLLNKARQPQRHQWTRGRLWVYLKRIRLRAANQTDDGMAKEAWSLCSRPHVFLQRNLLHCKKMFGKPSKSKAKPVHQQKHRGKSTWRLNSGQHQRRKKRKSSDKGDTPERLSVLDLTISSEDELPASDNLRREEMQRPEKVPKVQSVSDVSVFGDTQANGSGLDGTRRVLKFDAPPNAVQAETQKPKPCRLEKSAEARSHEGPADFTTKSRACPRRLGDDPREDLDVFRTPTDPFGADLKITRKIRQSGTRKDNFRSMLAALGQSHNKIIKESHH